MPFETGLERLQQAAARTRTSLAQHAARNLRVLAAEHGGSLSSTLDKHTTHLLAVLPLEAALPATASPVSATASICPLGLLEAVSQQCGGAAAVACLRQRLMAGQLVVLSSRLVFLILQVCVVWPPSFQVHQDLLSWLGMLQVAGGVLHGRR